ncbi:hypothetical protein E2562_031915 [Oryza meyeriana var. granulata]|uniref:Uncharacterized protein n=1 Tax=Oryza meyeriana var. granulata TaxID=110450 RepID=A0A6G1DQZ4_9ORYZ|nr:hypothetical protein E2562_031915 [Oryza meyeriana var. granulata]
MRLLQCDLSEEQQQELEQFAQWVLALGDGKLPASKKANESEATWIDIPDHLLIKTNGDKIYSIMGDTLLSELIQGDENERICVRVSRFWEFHDQRDETTVLHLGLVLIDEKIYPPCDEIFRPIITEGKVYYIKYYRVRKCSKRYKPVNNCMSICFTRWTTIEERVDPPANFPLYTYSLTPFGGLRSCVDKKDAFTVLNVALWGERATSFSADEVFAASQKEPQIVIFVGTPVRGYGSSACKWCINADTPEVNSLKNSIQGSYEPIKWIDLPHAATAHSNADPKSIAQIKDLNPFEFKSTVAAAPSIGFSNPPATPSIGLNSPSAVGAKGKSVEIECQSKTPNQILDEEDQDDDNLPLSQMGGHSATKNSTSKSYNKRKKKQALGLREARRRF